ncbi:MAG: hypothetical protein U0166_14255 [Acidobacteriota bacterium]
MSTYAVYRRPLGDPDGVPAKLGDYARYEDAMTAATDYQRQELRALHDEIDPAPDNAVLYEAWLAKGTDLFIDPDPSPIKFSVMDTGPIFILWTTGDTSRPLLFDVLCTDALQFASGGRSVPKQWRIFIKAPATYARAEHLLRRGVEMLYDDMSATALQAEGSSYCLLGCDIRPIDAAELERAIRGNPDPPVFRVGDRGLLAKDASS